jgi:hypothetical protein
MGTDFLADLSKRTFSLLFVLVFLIMSSSTVQPPYNAKKGQFSITGNMSDSSVTAGAVDLNPTTLGAAVGTQTNGQWSEIAASTQSDISKALADAGWVQKTKCPNAPPAHCKNPLVSAALSLVAFEAGALIVALVFYLVNAGKTISGSVGGDVALWAGASLAFFGVNTGMQSIAV